MCNYMPITDVYAREILDSRGNPAIEVEVLAEDGTVGRAAVPSGASAGYPEQRGDRENSNRGGSVRETCHFVNTILAAAIIGENIYAQEAVDHILSRKNETKDQIRPGAGGILGLSMAAAVTAAKSLRMPLFRYLGGAFSRRLPVPMVNILDNGSQTANAADLQEFMIMPCGADSFAEGLQMCAEVYRTLQCELTRRTRITGGGNAVETGMEDTEDVLTMILEAVEKAGYRPGQEIMLALDVAADRLFDRARGLYVFRSASRKKEHEVCRRPGEMTDWLEKLCDSFPIASIVDALAGSDRDGWKCLMQRLGSRIQLPVGGLPASGVGCVAQRIREKAGNAVLFRVNQTDTLTGAFAAVDLARQNGWKTIISHCFCDTEDTLIADLAVAVGSGQIRTGAPCHSEWVAKYNRLLRIEDFLGRDAVYRNPFAR